jgi:hypothetical protein
LQGLEGCLGVEERTNILPIFEIIRILLHLL